MGFKARQPPAAIDDLLAGKETRAVAFKPSAEALEQVDLVAFANSDEGGTILIGVEEPAARGASSATIVGCRGGVTERRKLQRLAKECIPPVKIALSEYKHDGKAVFRLDVAPSPSRPHCTAGGTYVIRKAGGIAPLAPDELAALMPAAGEQAAASMEEMQKAVDSAVKAVVKEVRGLPGRVRKTAEDTESTLDQIGARIENKIEELTDAVDASAEDSFLHIGLSTIRQAQKIGFQSLEGRLDQNSHLLLKIIRRMGLYRMIMQPVPQAVPKSRPGVVVVQLAPDFQDQVEAENAGEPPATEAEVEDSAPSED